MTSKKATYANIIISLIFAVVMIASAIIIDNADTERNVRFILIAIWLVPFLYLAKRQKS